MLPRNDDVAVLFVDLRRRSKFIAYLQSGSAEMPQWVEKFVDDVFPPKSYATQTAKVGNNTDAVLSCLHFCLCAFKTDCHPALSVPRTPAILANCQDCIFSKPSATAVITSNFLSSTCSSQSLSSVCRFLSMFEVRGLEGEGKTKTMSDGVG